jgi:hypothetical protein
MREHLHLWYVASRLNVALAIITSAGLDIPKGTTTSVVVRPLLHTGGARALAATGAPVLNEILGSDEFQKYRGRYHDGFARGRTTGFYYLDRKYERIQI